MTNGLTKLLFSGGIPFFVVEIISFSIEFLSL